MNKEARVAKKLHGSFEYLLAAVWKHLRLPPPDPIQIDIANALQYGPDRMVIEAFRGVGKSYITATFAAWLLFNDPDLTVLLLSASADKANDISQFILRLLRDVPFLQHLAPTGEQRASMLNFDVNGALAKQSPSVRSKGITGTITGGRAQFILADDIEVVENSATQTMRTKIREKVKELDNVISPGPGNRIIYLGTPQLQDSLYSVLPERGYTVSIWPMLFPDAKQVANYCGRLAPHIQKAVDDDPKLVGRPTEPRRFGELVVLEKKTTQGRTGFMLQYQLDTTMTDEQRHPLKLSDLMVIDINPERGPEKAVWATTPELVIHDVPNVGLRGDSYHRPMTFDGQRDAEGRVTWQPFTGCAMAIDPSGRGKDETGWAITKFLNGQVFLVDAGGFVGGYEPATLENLAKRAKKWGVNKIIVEANFGDGMWLKLFQPTLRRIYPCSVEEVRASSRAYKEQRIIDILEPVMNSHRLIVDKALITRDFHSTKGMPQEQGLQYQLFYQMSRLTRDRGSLAHDDRLEAVAWAVHYWLNQMSADADDRIDAQRDRLLQREIDDFMEHALGVRAGPPNWIQLP